jgi:ribosomal protein L20
LNVLPNDIFENPDTTWLDPCCGHGQFAILIFLRLMNGLKKVGCEMNRKILAELAIRDPSTFTAIAGTAKQALAT